ncbi:hypothetical protein SESBI_24900 [Sesbania bispinosa]|nr:hypothetical protein SESBI_24900 [Sesbania bispinosa]
MDEPIHQIESIEKEKKNPNPKKNRVVVAVQLRLPSRRSAAAPSSSHIAPAPAHSRRRRTEVFEQSHRRSASPPSLSYSGGQKTAALTDTKRPSPHRRTSEVGVG